MNELYYLYMWNQHYNLYDSCPAPSPQIIAPGIYDISLEQGEALYFDITPRLNAERTFKSYNYFIGVSNDIPSSDIAMNSLYTPCWTSQDRKRPIVFQTAKDESLDVDNSDTQFNYYRYYLSKSDTYIFTSKALNATINFKLKIPTQGEELGY